MKSKKNAQLPIYPSGKPRILNTMNVDGTQLAESAALAWAAALARKGKMIQAENLLLPIVNKRQSGTNVMDLLAKVYAQQKKFEQAQALWLKALQLEPNNIHFLRALLGIAKLIKQRQN